MIYRTALVMLVVLWCTTSALSADEPLSPQPEVVELSGILRRPVKWSPQLEIWPAGVIQRIDPKGTLVEGNAAKEDLKDGQAVKVWGVVRTFLHRGGTPENPSPFPTQWTIQLVVTRLEKLVRAEDVLRQVEN